MVDSNRPADPSRNGDRNQCSGQVLKIHLLSGSVFVDGDGLDALLQPHEVIRLEYTEAQIAEAMAARERRADLQEPDGNFLLFFNEVSVRSTCQICQKPWGRPRIGWEIFFVPRGRPIELCAICEECAEKYVPDLSFARAAANAHPAAWIFPPADWV
jgi:hypothetical protein